MSKVTAASGLQNPFGRARLWKVVLEEVVHGKPEV